MGLANNYSRFLSSHISEQNVQGKQRIHTGAFSGTFAGYAACYNIFQTIVFTKTQNMIHCMCTISGVIKYLDGKRLGKITCHDS